MSSHLLYLVFLVEIVYASELGGKWGKCGPTNLLPNGNPAQCSPGYCCSEWGYCGQGAQFCDCPKCIRYDAMTNSGIKMNFANN